MNTHTQQFLSRRHFMKSAAVTAGAFMLGTESCPAADASVKQYVPGWKFSYPSYVDDQVMYQTHPHGSFTPDSKGAVFNSSKNGVENIFYVPLPEWETLA